MDLLCFPNLGIGIEELYLFIIEGFKKRGPEKIK